jgi:hypothetical protein
MELTGEILINRFRFEKRNTGMLRKTIRENMNLFWDMQEITLSVGDPGGVCICEIALKCSTVEELETFIKLIS